MQTTTCQWNKNTGWAFPPGAAKSPQLVLYFGGLSTFSEHATALQELLARFPQAAVCGCSTAGEILGHRVQDDSVVAALVEFKTTKVRAVAEHAAAATDSEAVGRRAAARLNAPDLRHVLLLSDGLHINGTALVRGMRETLAPEIAITGGMAGDAARFQKTLVGLGSEVSEAQIVAIGLYGNDLVVGFGSRGGWEGFGPRRRITRSEGNVLFELDDQPALALYKRYLGERAAGLPATGLLFPLELTEGPADTDGVVRTILAVDEDRQSLTFAGDLPQKQYVRLMKATDEQIVGGAAAAGTEAAANSIPSNSLALMVSCVGRRLVLRQRTEEELESALRSLPAKTESIGFYSYGEVCPSKCNGFSELHNQTMTITLISERS